MINWLRPLKKIGQRFPPLGRIELVGLVDPQPRQCPPVRRELLTLARKRLFFLEMGFVRFKPIRVRRDDVVGHVVLLPLSGAC
ncbi:hypothetical protein HNQ71_005001 [Mesorhizobium sangaii]|uniref:Uncharacterized protein n=1 Tax=Mesorhizobium sangaii TaxID=505389 RepID=A0A841PEU4_9HYPH|nr:hypothetical protein [Mesorhizobium sangaii]